MSSFSWRSSPATNNNDKNERYNSSDAVENIYSNNKLQLQSILQSVIPQINNTILQWGDKTLAYKIIERTARGLYIDRQDTGCLEPSRNIATIAPQLLQKGGIVAPTREGQLVYEKPLLGYESVGRDKIRQQVDNIDGVLGTNTRNSGRNGRSISSRERNKRVGSSPLIEISDQSVPVRVEEDGLYEPYVYSEGFLSGPHSQASTLPYSQYAVSQSTQLFNPGPAHGSQSAYTMGPPSVVSPTQQKPHRRYAKKSRVSSVATTHLVDDSVENSSVVSGSDRTCHECNKIFSFPRDLKSHMTAHHEGGVKCDHCPEQLSTTYSLKRHLATKHGIGMQCDDCPLVFGTLNALNKHRAKDHNIGVLCGKCNVVVVAEDSIDMHMLEKHNIGFRCEVCGMVSQNEGHRRACATFLGF